MKDFTHRELCIDLAINKGTPYYETPLGSKWLGVDRARQRNYEIRKETKCSYDEAEKQVKKERVNTQQVDVIKFTPSYTRFCVDIFEVKRDRSDFLKDIREGKWEGYLPHCHRFYFACLTGVCKKDEMPEGVGLYVRGKKGWTCVKQATSRDVEIPRETLMACLFKQDRLQQNEFKKSYMANYRSIYQYSHFFGKELRRIISFFLKSGNRFKRPRNVFSKRR